MDFLVLGSPIAHSLSPVIHKSFAKEFSIHLNYDKDEVKQDALKAKLEQLYQQGVSGLNLTSPLKEKGYELTVELSERAKQAKAVNTLKRIDAGWYGDNTDGIGLVQDITVNNGVRLTDQKVLILGAGGATRGILGPILAEKPQLVYIANRTKQKALAIMDDFKSYGNIGAGSYDELSKRSFDVIIHATSLGVQGKIPDMPKDFSPNGSFCYDLSYANASKPFIKWATERGALQAVSGLGMLVEQAAAGFLLWHDKKPQTKDVLAKLFAEVK